MRRIPVRYLLLDSISATTVTSGVNVSDFRNAVLAIGASAGTFKIFIKGGIGFTSPTFSSGKSISNRWDFIDVVDLEDGASIDGDTGIVFTGADTRLVEINVNSIDWLAINLTAITVAATVSAEIGLTTNE